MALGVKNPPANAGDVRDAGLIPGLGRSSGIGNGNSLQYSCLENPMDRGAWRATVHGVGYDSTAHGEAEVGESMSYLQISRCAQPKTLWLSL